MQMNLAENVAAQICLKRLKSPVEQAKNAGGRFVGLGKKPVAGRGDAAEAITSQHFSQVKGTHLTSERQTLNMGNNKDSHGGHFLSLPTVFSVKHTVWVY